MPVAKLLRIECAKLWQTSISAKIQLCFTGMVPERGDWGENFSRRRLLALLGVSSLPGLAGCDQQLREVVGDLTSPEKTNLDVNPTENAGELVFTISAQDNEELRKITVSAEGETILEKDVEGGQASLTNQTVDARSANSLRKGKVNELDFQVEDASGNKITQQQNSYVRKYDKLVDTRLDIGAVYLSQQGDGFRQGCLDDDGDTEPAVGVYASDPIPSEITSRHLDQMTGHGINHILYDYAGKWRDDERLPELLKSELIAQVEIEPFYTKIPLIRRMDENWRDDILPEDLSFLRDQVLTRDNVATYNGRPVVSTWNFVHFAQPDSDARDKLLGEFGSYRVFVDEMRGHLRTDGKEPYLVIGKGSITALEGDTEWVELIQQFDAATNWVASSVLEPNSITSWEDAYDAMKENYRSTRQFTDEHDMDFIPMAFPGYDERENTCYGFDRVISRSPEHLQQLMELADEYRTGDRINIASFNDWLEGHAIEPGMFRGRTTELSTLRRFRNSKVVDSEAYDDQWREQYLAEFAPSIQHDYPNLSLSEGYNKAEESLPSPRDHLPRLTAR